MYLFQEDFSAWETCLNPHSVVGTPYLHDPRENVKDNLNQVRRTNKNSSNRVTSPFNAPVQNFPGTVKRVAGAGRAASGFVRVTKDTAENCDTPVTISDLARVCLTPNKEQTRWFQYHNHTSSYIKQYR